MHLSRIRRKLNRQRRAEVAEKQRPLPPDKQQDRAESNRAAHQKRYPTPPVYRPAHNAPAPDQPWCYLTERERKGR